MSSLCCVFFSIISLISFYSQDQQWLLPMFLDFLHKSEHKQENYTNAAMCPRMAQIGKGLGKCPTSHMHILPGLGNTFLFCVNMVWCVVLHTQSLGNVQRRCSYYLPLKIAELLEIETNSDLVSFPFS